MEDINFLRRYQSSNRLHEIKRKLCLFLIFLTASLLIFLLFRQYQLHKLNQQYQLVENKVLNLANKNKSYVSSLKSRNRTFGLLLSINDNFKTQINKLALLQFISEDLPAGIIFQKTIFDGGALSFFARSENERLIADLTNAIKQKPQVEKVDVGELHYEKNKQISFSLQIDCNG